MKEVATAVTARAVAGFVIAAVLASPARAQAPSPMADIADLYAWNDGANLSLVMDVSPLDNGTHAFDPTVVYVFHLNSKSAPRLGVPDGVETRVICRFASNTSVECWATGAAGTKDYLSGNPSNAAGAVSLRGKLRVFAGRRSDPAFADRAGFNTAAGLLRGVQATPDGANCPTAIDPSIALQIRTALGGGMDSFATANVMAIVVQIDKSLVLVDSDKIVSVWASTHAGS